MIDTNIPPPARSGESRKLTKLFYQHQQNKCENCCHQQKNHGKLIFNPPAPNHEKAVTHTQTLLPCRQQTEKKLREIVRKRKKSESPFLLIIHSLTVYICVSDPHLAHTQTHKRTKQILHPDIRPDSAVLMQGLLYNLFLLSLPQSL